MESVDEVLQLLLLPRQKPVPKKQLKILVEGFTVSSRITPYSSIFYLWQIGYTNAVPESNVRKSSGL